jgi:hypothetical protein
LADRRHDVIDVAVEPLEQDVPDLVDLAHLRQLVGKEDDLPGVRLRAGLRGGLDAACSAERRGEKGDCHG